MSIPEPRSDRPRSGGSGSGGACPAPEPARSGKAQLQPMDGTASQPSRSGLVDESRSPLEGPVNIRSVVLTGIFTLMLLYTLYFASPVLIPVSLAFLLTILLTPIVEALARLRIPEPVGALVALLIVVSIVIGGLYGLSGPAAEWIDKAPQSMHRLKQHLHLVRKPIEDVKRAQDQMEELTELDDKPKVVAVEETSLVAVIRDTTGVLTTVGIAVILMYFLLASKDVFVAKLVRLSPRLREKKRTVEIVREIQHAVSTYLLTVTAINIGLGTVAGLVLYVLGMPNPLLWGVLVGVLNFAPYIGAAVSFVILTAAAILTFDSLTQVAYVPLAFVVLTALEGQLITPMILGRRLALSPVVVFLALVVWGWLWGWVGLLVAIPLLVMLKITCERLPQLNTVAELIGP